MEIDWLNCLNMPHPSHSMDPHPTKNISLNHQAKFAEKFLSQISFLTLKEEREKEEDQGYAIPEEES